MTGRDYPSGHAAHALAIRAAFGSLSREELAGAAAALHQRFRDECSRLLAQRSKQMQESLAKEGKRLQQSLSPFLSTPLRSDAAEVGLILKESLNRILEDTRGADDPSGPSLSTGLFVTPSFRKTRDKELFHRGTLMLRSMCGLPPKHEEPLVELLMSARGGTAAAALEDLLAVRGLVPHEMRVRDVSALTLVAEGKKTGDQSVGTAGPSLLVWFHTGEEAEETVVSGVHEMVQPMLAEMPVRSVALWQRRLGVMAWGYELRCSLDSGLDPGDVIEWMHGRAEFTRVTTAAHVETGFLLKEFLA
jgi:hypothetical protein